MPEAEGSEEPGRGYHYVRQGENLTLIAVGFGFANDSVIYNHPNNAEIRNTRDNTDVLHPGDPIFIPHVTVREESRAVDSRYRFVLKLPKKVLRITVQDDQGQAIANKPYELTIYRTPGLQFIPDTETETYRGLTGLRGEVEQTVPLQASKGSLKVGGVRWELEIGHLNPGSDTLDSGVSGIQARLKNLAFDPGPIDGICGRRTENAIRAFQAKFKLKVDGICGPKTWKKLKAEHGS